MFLVQISGEKTWKIESQPMTEDRSFLKNLNIQILQTFQPDQEYTVTSGDILYLPAQIPHWGIAKEDCITASVGFKVPNQTTMGHALGRIAEKLTWNPELHSGIDIDHLDDPGRVNDSTIDWFQGEMRRLTEDRMYLAQTLCRGITQLHLDAVPGEIWHSPSTKVIRSELLNGVVILRQSPSLIVYHEFDDRIGVYSMGQEYILRKELKPFAQLLTGCERLNYDALKPYLDNKQAMNLLKALFKLGVVIGSGHD